MRPCCTSMSVVGLVAGFLLCAGCCAQARAEGRCRWKIPLLVDSLFTARERAEIVVAASNWTVASDHQICFKIGSRDTTGDEKTFRSDCEHVIYSSWRPWQVKVVTTAESTPCPRGERCLGITIWEHGGRWSDIFVLTSEIPILRATVEHELGHLLGLKHTPVYESIMFDLTRRDKLIARVDRDALACLISTQSLFLGADRCTPRRVVGRRACVTPNPRGVEAGKTPPVLAPAGVYERLVQRGHVLGEKGRTRQACKLFERAARLRPNRVLPASVRSAPLAARNGPPPCHWPSASTHPGQGRQRRLPGEHTRGESRYGAEELWVEVVASGHCAAASRDAAAASVLR